MTVTGEIGATALIVTHNAVVADIADRVIRFSNGAVVDVHRNAASGRPRNSPSEHRAGRLPRRLFPNARI